jgi:hypothetical protein
VQQTQANLKLTSSPQSQPTDRLAGADRLKRLSWFDAAKLIDVIDRAERRTLTALCE